MDQLLKTGKVRRGMLGVTIQSVDADLAASLNLPAASGAIVTSVSSGGPAERAGVKRGDVITSVNNQPVSDTNGLRNLVAGMAPGSNATLAVLRGGREQTFQVALAELPERPRSEGEDSDSEGTSGNEKFGLTLQPLNADTASKFGLDASDQGLLVTKVDPSGAAANAGLRAGDLIQEVNQRPVRTFTDFSAAIQQSGARPALLLVKRRNAVVYVTLRPGS
jgi:serine protease Do